MSYKTQVDGNTITFSGTASDGYVKYEKASQGFWLVVTEYSFESIPGPVFEIEHEIRTILLEHVKDCVMVIFLDNANVWEQ